MYYICNVKLKQPIVLLTIKFIKMAYLVNVDFGQILVIANNISEVDKKIKEAGIFHYEIEKVIEYVL